MQIDHYDPFSILPSDMAVNIFGQLNFNDLRNCCLVGKLWSQLTDQNAIWRKKAEEKNISLKERPKEIKLQVEDKWKISSSKKLYKIIYEIFTKASKDKMTSIHYVSASEPNKQFYAFVGGQEQFLNVNRDIEEEAIKNFIENKSSLHVKLKGFSTADLAMTCFPNKGWKSCSNNYGGLYYKDLSELNLQQILVYFYHTRLRIENTTQ